MDDYKLEQFYRKPEDNSFTLCHINQYLVIETDEEIIDKPYLWNGEEFREVQYKLFNSDLFGQVKPKSHDPFQICYFDSLIRNQLTFCTGPAGSGKSLIALSYGFQELEKGAVSKIIVFCNPYVADGAVKMGFYPGSKREKILETSIGSVLLSKLGGALNVDRLLDEEKLILMPMGDCRGYEVPEDSFVYFTEAQNMDRPLMKLFLQRTNDNCKICVEGDTVQVDSERFHNGLNGLVRAIEIFQGEDYAGHVHLPNIYRGKIARKAEEICD